MIKLLNKIGFVGALCVAFSPAFARVCFLPDAADCQAGNVKYPSTDESNGCELKSKAEAETKIGKNECQEAYQSGLCYYIRCKDDKKQGYFSTMSECQKQAYEVSLAQTEVKKKCVPCSGGCWKLEDSPIGFDVYHTCKERGYVVKDACKADYLKFEAISLVDKNGETCGKCAKLTCSEMGGYKTKATCTGDDVEFVAVDKIDANGTICGNCVKKSSPEPDDKDLYLYVTTEGMCHKNIHLTEGNGVTKLESVNTGYLLYKIAYGTTVTIQAEANQTEYDSDGKISRECKFDNWEFDNLYEQFTQFDFTYDEDMYQKLKSADNTGCSSLVGSFGCPETLNIFDDDCDTGACQAGVTVASISAARAIPYNLSLKSNAKGDSYTDSMSNYEFYVLYEPKKERTQYNATAYKCHLSGYDGNLRNYLPNLTYNYIGFLNNRPYLVGDYKNVASKSNVDTDLSYTDPADNKDKKSNSSIALRDSYFGVYDNMGTYDSISQSKSEGNIVYCEEYKLPDGYMLNVLSNEGQDNIGMAEGVMSNTYFSTTGNRYPDSYLTVKIKAVKGDKNKATFEYKYVGNNFPYSTGNNLKGACHISCGDMSFNEETINNGQGIDLKCKDGSCANGQTGSITVDYIVSEKGALAPKTLLPTGCTCQCGGGYTCIIE